MYIHIQTFTVYQEINQLIDRSIERSVDRSIEIHKRVSKTFCVMTQSDASTRLYSSFYKFNV